MKTWLWIGLFVLLGTGILLTGSNPARAIDPTPTLLPTYPTATSAAQYFHITPTPMIIQTIPAFDLNINSDVIADQVVGTYNAFNSSHIIDLALFLLTCLMIIRMAGQLIASITGKS